MLTDDPLEQYRKIIHYTCIGLLALILILVHKTEHPKCDSKSGPPTSPLASSAIMINGSKYFSLSPWRTHTKVPDRIEILGTPWMYQLPILDEATETHVVLDSAKHVRGLATIVRNLRTEVARV